ncbi:MAG: hypothetical protein BME93_01185 [Methanosarcinales archaeon Met12]|nr:MAG: hypothetical protein BME93_01185 [Methanosarcinales archaeon Met12]
MEVIASLLIALIGAIAGVIVYIHAVEIITKKKLLTALIEELQENKEILKSEVNSLELEAIRNATRKLRISYYSDSYIAARNAGILASLPKETRNKLMGIYIDLRYLNGIVTTMDFGLMSFKKEKRIQAPVTFFKRHADDTDDLIKDLKKL